MVKATEGRVAGAASPSYYEYEVKDASPAFVRELRQRVAGCHWEYQTRMLEILEWVCGTDRQFERARKQALDLINGEERALVAILARSLAPRKEGERVEAR